MSRALKRFCLAATLVTCIAVPPAGAGIVDPQELSVLGFGDIDGMVVRDGYAICGTSLGLAVFDVSDPANPTLVTTRDIPGYRQSLTVSGSYLYLFFGSSLVQVYDISNPADPLLLATWEGIPSAYDVAISGDYAYLLPLSDPDLVVLDISDPAHPTEAGSFASGDSVWANGSIQIANGCAWIVHGSGLGVLDITNPADLKLLTEYRLADVAVSFAISGQYLYLTLRDSGLHVFDISAPQSPVEVGAFATEGRADQVAIDGALLYLLDWTPSERRVHCGTVLRVLSLANPAAPAQVASFTTFEELDSVLVLDGRAYSSLSSGGFMIVDVAADPPVALGCFRSPSVVSNVAVSGDRAYFATYWSYVSAVDISDPMNPVLLGTYDTEDAIEDMAAHGDCVYLGSAVGGLSILDFTDPLSPVAAYSDPTLNPGSTVELALSFPWLYVCDTAQTRLLVYDVTDPHAPALVGVLPGVACDLAVWGHLVCAETHDGLYVVDVSTPAAPTVLSLTPLVSFTNTRLAAANGYLYRSLDPGLEIFDLSNPASPLCVGLYLGPGDSLGSLELPGCYVYLSDGNRLLVFDVSNPATPTEAGVYQARGPVMDSAVRGRDIFVADGSRGLVLLRHPYPFTDLPAGFWAVDYIRACCEAGLVAGYWDDTYRPSLLVSRDQMAVFIARGLAGGDEYVPTGPATATFGDVATGQWAYRHIEYCYDNGIVTGYWDGYHPEETVNRAQMAVFVSRAVAGGDDSVPDDPDGTPFFPDVLGDHWAYKYIEYCHDYGVVTGYWDGYHPDEVVNRAQMAVFVARAFELPM